MDWAALNKKWAEKDTWHISCSGIRSPAIFAPQNWGLSFETGGGISNWFSNADMDKAFANTRSATNAQQRIAAYRQVQDLFYQTLPYIQVVDTFGVEAIRSNIKGFQPWMYNTRPWGLWREK